MDLSLYKRLIRMVEKSDISEFSVEEGDIKIRIVKNSGQFAPLQAIPVAQSSGTVQTRGELPASTEEKSETSTLPASNLHEVKSPIVGTFYRAPAPDADPFVQVGDKISEGSVLCIVEAMKLMNEIESDTGGKIVKILVENGTPVEYNQPLFLIEKD